MSASLDARQRVLVWDLPTRIFHGLLAASFLTAWTIAVTTDDENRLFALHGGLGLFIAGLLAFRLVWGLIGTRWARFGAFGLRPADLVAYLKGVVKGSGPVFTGHNPASAWAVVAMGILLVGLIATGVMLGLGSESAEDLHELFAHSMLGVVAIHVLGVALHTLRHRDPIALGMLDGRKRVAPGGAIRSARPVSALLLCAVLASWAGGLWRGWDPAAGTVRLPVLGSTLALAEIEEEHEHEREHTRGGPHGDRRAHDD